MFDGAGSEEAMAVEPVRVITLTIIIYTQEHRTSRTALSQTGQQAVFLPGSRAEGEFSTNETQRPPANPTSAIGTSALSTSAFNTSALNTSGLMKSEGLSAINALFSSTTGNSLGRTGSSVSTPALVKGSESSRTDLPFMRNPQNKVHAIDRALNELAEPTSFAEQNRLVGPSFSRDERGLVGMLTIDAALDDSQGGATVDISEELYGTIAAETLRLFPSQVNQTQANPASITAVDTAVVSKTLAPVRAYRTSFGLPANDHATIRKAGSFVKLGHPEGMISLEMKPNESHRGQPVLQASLDPIALVQLFLRAGESPAPGGSAFSVSAGESSRETTEFGWHTWLRDRRVASLVSITLGIFAMATARKSRQQGRGAPFLVNEVGNERNCR